MAETTASIIITPAIRFYSGVSAQLGDQDFRERALWGAQMGSDRLNVLAPVWWKHGNGTATVTGNQTYGTLPTDFGAIDQDTQIYINGQAARPPLKYLDPAVLRDRLQRDSSVRTTYPEFFTLEGKNAAGLSQIRVADTPSGNITLDVLGYAKTAPILIDAPVAPSLADGSAAGNPSGAYTGRVTFVTAAGETEGGLVSASLSVTARKIQWSGIPLPPDWLIGTVVGRKLYRTAAGGVQHKLVPGDPLSTDVLTTSYLDNTADGSLGANVPNVSTATLTGIERFPKDWQRVLLFEYTKAWIAQGQGDARDNKWFDDWEKRARDYWSKENPDATKLRAMPRFRQRPAIERPRTYRERLS